MARSRNIYTFSAILAAWYSLLEATAFVAN